jgi:hypothetical protein
LRVAIKIYPQDDEVNSAELTVLAYTSSLTKLENYLTRKEREINLVVQYESYAHENEMNKLDEEVALNTKLNETMIA